MGRHKTACKRQYRKRNRQAKKLKKKELCVQKPTTYSDCQSQTSDEQHEQVEETATTTSSTSSLQQSSSSASPFECTSSCCLSDVSDYDEKKPDQSLSSKLIKNLTTLKKAKETRVSRNKNNAAQMHSEPLYIRWQEYKLLNKRIREIESANNY